MRRPDEDDAFAARLRRARPGDMGTPDFKAWRQAHADAVQRLHAQAHSPGHRAPRWGFGLPTWGRVAAAVLLLLGGGFALGRFSGPRSLDVEQLRSDIEASLRQEVITPIGDQWHATLQASCDQLRMEILQQLHQDFGDLATQTLAASKAITDRQMTELIRLIEAARERDRQRVALALQQIEANRQRDRVELGSGLQLLAAQSTKPGDSEIN